MGRQARFLLRPHGLARRWDDWAAATSSNWDAACWALDGGTWSSANAYTIAGASLAEHWASGINGSAIFVSPYGPDSTNQTYLGDGAVLAGRASDSWAIAGPAARHGAYNGWEPATSLFQQAEYVHAAANGDVWVTGLDPEWKALAARWDGAQWSLFPMGIQNDPPVAASNGTDVWLANTSLWHWSGGALQQLPYPRLPRSPSAPVWSSRHLFAVPGAVWVLVNDAQGTSSALLRTDGKTWRFVLLPVGYRPASAGIGFAGTSDRDLWLVSGLSVFHYDGQAWSVPVILPGSGQFGIRDIWPLGTDDVWAGLYHFDGSSWTATAPADSLGEIYAMWADADDDVWALTSTGLRRFDGQTWSAPVALPNGDFWYGLSAVSSRDLWIAGYDGVIHGAPPARPNDPTQILSISPTIQ